MLLFVLKTVNYKFLRLVVRDIQQIRKTQNQVLGKVKLSLCLTKSLGPTQPPIQWVLGALSLGVKRPGR